MVVWAFTSLPPKQHLYWFIHFFLSTSLYPTQRQIDYAMCDLYNSKLRLCSTCIVTCFLDAWQEFDDDKDHVVPPTHPVYQHVVSVVRKIVDSNQDLEFMREQTWTIIVVDSDEINAFVLPVCTGLFCLTHPAVTSFKDNFLIAVIHMSTYLLICHRKLPNTSEYSD